MAGHRLIGISPANHLRGIRAALPIIDDPDIFRAACFMVEEYGESAVSAAALRALDLARLGQDQASAIWIRIGMVVQDLQRGRREGETVH